MLQIQAKGGVAGDLADPLADLVANAARGLDEYDVIGKSDIESIIGLEKLRDSLGCDDLTCFAEIGGALGVELLVAGNVSRIGSALLLNLRLINPRRMEVVAGVSHKISGGDEGIIDAVPRAVAELFGASVPAGASAGVAATSLGKPTLEDFRTAGLSSDDFDEFRRSNHTYDEWALRRNEESRPLEIAKWVMTAGAVAGPVLVGIGIDWRSTQQWQDESNVAILTGSMLILGGIGIWVVDLLDLDAVPPQLDVARPPRG